MDRQFLEECLGRGMSLETIGGVIGKHPSTVGRDVSAWRRRMKRLLVGEAGGRCQICGYDRYMGALQFHHVDPAEKSFPLSMRGCTRSIAELRTEAAKCQLLCANCHAEVEHGVAEGTADTR